MNTIKETETETQISRWSTFYLLYKYYQCVVYYVIYFLAYYVLSLSLSVFCLSISHKCIKISLLIRDAGSPSYMSRSAHKELSWLTLINSSSTPSQDWHYLYDDPIRITGDLDRRKLHVQSVNNSLDPPSQAKFRSFGFAVISRGYGLTSLPGKVSEAVRSISIGSKVERITSAKLALK